MAGKADKDNYRSRQRIALLMAISEGELEEISSIYLNDVGIESYSAAFAYTLGTLNQVKIPGFDVVGSGVTTPIEITALTLGGEVNYKILGPFNYEIEFVDITITMPEGAYWHTAADNLRQTDIEIEVGTSVDGVNFTTKNQTIDGSTYPIFKRHLKSISPYAWSARIERPTNIITQWHIRLRRRTIDATSGSSTDSYYKTKTNYSYQTYQNVDGATYAGTALLAVRIEDAAEVNNSVPTISGYGKGLKVRVPNTSYYNAGERSYFPAGTGTTVSSWDGSFATNTKYTNNLAWILYNMKSDALKKSIPTVEELIGLPSITKDTSQFATVTLTAHGLVTGDEIQVIAAIGFNRTRVAITKIDANTFTYDTLTPGTATITTGISLNKWITEDIIVGEGVPEAYMAKYTFNTFANYCDTKIHGEFRYSLNGQFVERVGSTEFLNSLLSIGNANFTEINGLVSIVYEKKLTDLDLRRAPLLVNENVDEGIFEYSESPLSETYTQVNITIQDASNFNKTKTVITDSISLVKYLRDNSLLATYGIPLNATNDYFIKKYSFNSSDITLQGVTTDYAAVRKGRSLLWDSLINNQFVTFKTLIEGATFYRGQVLQILDSDNSGQQDTGRILAKNNNAGILTLTLDRQVTLGAGTNYIRFYKDTSVYVSTPLTDTETLEQLIPQEYMLNNPPGTTNIVTITTGDSPNLIDTNVPETIFAIRTSNIGYWTVIGNHYEDGKYLTTCMRYDTTKFDFVESLYTSATTNFANIQKLKVNPVSIRDVDITTFDDVITASVTYANKADRLADTAYTPANIGLIAHQTSDSTDWVITNVVLGAPNVVSWRQTSLSPVGTGVLVKGNEAKNGNVILTMKWLHADTNLITTGRRPIYEVHWANDAGDNGILISYTKSASLLYKIPTDEPTIVFTFKFIAKAALSFDSAITTIVKEYAVNQAMLIDLVGLIEGETNV